MPAQLSFGKEREKAVICIRKLQSHSPVRFNLTRIKIDVQRRRLFQDAMADPFQQARHRKIVRLLDRGVHLRFDRSTPPVEPTMLPYNA